MVNGINWDLKTSNASTYQYIQSLIKIRRTHPAFRMQTATLIANHLVFQNHLPEGIIAYTLNGAAVGDSWKKIWVGFNGSERAQTVELPAGNWKIASINNLSYLKAKQLLIDGSSAVILYQ